MSGDNKFGFSKIKSAIFQVLKPELPKQVAQLSLLFFRTNFNKGGYTDRSFTPWQQRKYRVNRKLLVKTGTMRDSFKVTSESFSKISITNDTEYFAYHNEGTDKLPKRQMLGESAELDKQIEKLIDENIMKLFR